MYLAWRRHSKMCVVLGSGYASGIEWVFSCRKSTHSRISPDFLPTSTIGALWGLREGSIKSLRSSSSICSSIILCIAGFLGKYLCLMGLSYRIVIVCSAIFDTPVNPSNLANSSCRNLFTQGSNSSCSAFAVIAASAPPVSGVYPGLTGEGARPSSTGSAETVAWFRRNGLFRTALSSRDPKILLVGVVCTRYLDRCLLE